MTFKKAVIFGGTGQVGEALTKEFTKFPDIKIFPVTRKEVDLTDIDSLELFLNAHRFDLVINAAAYTSVDLAEINSVEAVIVNSDAPALLAKYCKVWGAPLVHYSSDYVYSGDGVRPWHEDDATLPCNKYGASKLKGDLAIIESGAPHLIFRTSWVYAATGKNFVKTMLKLGMERDEIRLIADQVGSPTYAHDLAKATLSALFSPSFIQGAQGIFHLSNKGECSWYTFAQEIFRLGRKLGFPLRIKNLIPVASSEYSSVACRPLNSRLDMTKIETQLGIRMRDWKSALGACMLKLREDFETTN